MVLATVLALGSALLHATWNLLVKTSDDHDLAAWGQFAAGAVLALPLLILVGLPARETWPNLAGSAVVHVAYVIALAQAYRHSDFSLAYPMARGIGAALAAVGAVVLLDDRLSAPAWLAVLLVVAGLVSLSRPGRTRAALAWAGATGVAIGAYTLIDASGARRSDGLQYAFALAVATGVSITIVQLARGRRLQMIESARQNWARYTLAGALLTAAYAAVLVAVRHAPVGYVAVLRESSVVLGAAAGWFLLDESHGARRLASATTIVIGLAALVVLA